MSKQIRGNHLHLTLSDRVYIETSLNENKSFKDIAKYLCKDPTTISKEVHLHREEKLASTFNSPNRCALVGSCKLVNVCHMHISCGRLCKKCSSCNAKCSEFQARLCSKNSKAPFVCNGCVNKQGCRLLKYYYRAEKAHNEYRTSLVCSRDGVNLSEYDLSQLDLLVSPLILKGQPLAHIFSFHKGQIPCCRRTLYNYLDDCILTAKNIDLPRRVRYKIRRKGSRSSIIRDHSWLEGRRYDDFVEFMSSCTSTSVVEMDTVEGIKGGKVLLTLLFRHSNFMLAFILESKTQACVLDIFNQIEEALGTQAFRKLFPIILTDNGSEFINPTLIEAGMDSFVRTSVYYCNPGASYQKGGLEKNHEFIRYIIPQGVSFDSYTQEDITLMINNINSVARDGLNGRTPIEIASLLLDPAVFTLLQIKQIDPDDVILKPSLLK